MSANGDIFITPEDKEILANSCQTIIDTLSKYDAESSAFSVLNCAKSNAKFLSDCISFLTTSDDGKGYICYVTNKRINISECNDCHTVSCPVNTGYAPGPEPVK